MINHANCNILPRLKPTGIAIFDQFITISALQGRSLKTTRRVILIINLLAWIVLAGTEWPPLGAGKRR
jgi:hypothetical protein